jgi:phosphoribosylaminoimidazole carboxylase PurE protein
MTRKATPEVALVMGSDSDWDFLASAVATLDDFGIACEVRVISAHRTPDLAAEFARGAERRGIKVIIAAAGGAAHLGGVLAAQTTLPVICIPVEGGALKGIDALLASVQMPAGIPVGVVTLGKAGPVNAAVLAAQILATGKPALRGKLRKLKKALKRKVVSGNKKVVRALCHKVTKTRK